MKKFLSFLLVGVMSSMLFGQATFAAYTTVSLEGSVTDDTPYYYDSESHTNGDIYVLADANDPSALKVYKWTAASSTWSDLGTVIHTAAAGYWHKARIDVNASGNPGVVYIEREDFDVSTNVYLREYNGTSWDSAEIVDSSINDRSSIDISYYSDDVAAIVIDDKTLITGDIIYYEGNSAPFTTEIVRGVTLGANSLGVETRGNSSLGSVHIITGHKGMGSDLNYYTSGDGGTSFSSDEGIWSDTINSDSSDENISTSIDTDGNFRFLIGDDNTEGTMDYLYYGYYDAGWQKVTVASAVDMIEAGGTTYSLATDLTTDYVAYNDLSTPGFYAVYSTDQTTWNEVMVDETLVPNPISYSYAGVAVSDDEVVAFTSWFDELDALSGEYFWTITGTGDVEQGGGGEGESVPEFSTYVYIGMILVAFGIMYYAAPKSKMEAR